MQIETKDLKAITKKFFAVYGAHDVEAMTALCADDAKGRYAPYGREYVVPVRVGLTPFGKVLRRPFRISMSRWSKCFKQKVTPSWCRLSLAAQFRRTPPAVSRRKATTYASRTLISSATTRTAKSPTSIVIGTTHPSIASRQAHCRYSDIRELAFN